MPKFSVRKPLTIFVAMLAILVLGVVAYLKMTPTLFPNMDFPYVIIMTTDPGASPESVETDVTKPMEQSMATLDQIKSVTSSSRDSVSLVVLEFEQGVNMDTTSVDIQQQIAILQGNWDDNIGTPYVLKINPSMLPVTVTAVSYSGKDISEVSDFVEDTLSNKLDGITGVASVENGGIVDRELHVVLSQEKIDALSASISDAINRQLDNAAGELQSTRAQVQSAQSAMADAQRSAVNDAATNALTAVQGGLSTMYTRRDQVQEKLNDLTSLQTKKLTVEAGIAPYAAQIAAINNNPTLSDEEKKEQSAAIENNSDYKDLLSQQSEIDAKLAALGSDAESLEQDITDLQNDLSDINKQIEEFSQDNSQVAEISQQITDGAMTISDGAMQLIGANMQMTQALSKIDEGLATIESSRSEALKKADLSSALNISSISAILTAQNFSMPAGYVQDDDGVSYMVSVGDEITNQKDLKNMVLFDLGMDGVKPIRLKDVAEVFVTDNSDEIYAKLNGDDGIILSFTKQSTYAVAEVSDNIAHRLAQLEAQYDGLHFTSLMDQGDYIYMIINSILSSLGWGALFAILVLYLFLRDWRPTVITLVSIPISVIFAVVLMYFSGVTINMISLSGLAVAVGMLVDNSVVVIENIYRLRSQGASVTQAAVGGAKQVLGAITASTLTTVCVFLPIVFVEGITKQLFTDLALTMTYSLLASLLIALTLVPAMASGLLKKTKPQRKSILDKVYPAYRKAITWSLGHKAVVLILAVVLLAGSTVATVSRGFAFMPEMDMNTINLTVTMPEDCDRETAVKLADEVVQRASTVENVETVGAMMSSGDMSFMSSDSGEFDVTAYVLLPEGASGNAAGKEIEKLCADMDCKVTAAGGMDNYMSYMTGSGITLNVYGDDMNDLQSTAKDLAAELKDVKGISDVSDGLDEAAAAVHISIDRNKAMQQGMTVAQIYMQVASALTTSSSAAELTLDNLNMDVVLESAKDSQFDRDSLLDLVITGTSSLTGEAISFPLKDVATIEKSVSMNTIAHDQQRRYVSVTAMVADGYNITKVTSAAEKAVDHVKLPNGITTAFDGENEAIMEAMEQLMLMMLLGVLLVYFIMVAQFQSLKSPLIVMFTIPLAFTGGLLALLISGVELSVVSLIGFVMLVGIIVNNGIVLVDYINQQRHAGMERRAAIVDAGVTRLRPILMTSLTTILGLVVMAFSNQTGTALMRPIALVCIGGLLYATLMTLFVVPCMYDIFNRKELRHVDESDLTIDE